MHKTSHFVLPCLLALAACGTEDSSAPVDGGQPDAGSDAETDTSPDDVSSDAADADAAFDTGSDTVEECDGSPPLCAYACAGDNFEIATCADGAWACPDGTTPIDECPPNSCLGMPMPGEVCDDGWQCRPWETDALPACDGEAVQLCADCTGFPDTYSPELGCDCTCVDGIVSCGASVDFPCSVSSESTLSGVSIDIALPDDCVFTLEEAAAGLDFSYVVVVQERIDGVTAEALDAGNCDPDDVAGFAPFERVAGNDQNWCICDEGLCDPTPDEPGTIEVGTTSVPFTWFGRNFEGPSDTGFEEGAPFPPGDYIFSVTMRGTLDRGGDAAPEPYEVRAELSFRLVE